MPEARSTGPEGVPAVVCMNGGQGAQVPGTWSATIEWLVRRLAPGLPDLRFAWSCATGSSRGSGSTGASRTRWRRSRMRAPSERYSWASRWEAPWRCWAAAHPSVTGVLGLAPWLHDRLDLAPLRAGGWTCCTARSTAGCPASPVSARRSRAAASSGPGRSESRGRTRSSPGPSTASRCGDRRESSWRCPAPHAGPELAAADVARFRKA